MKGGRVKRRLKEKKRGQLFHEKRKQKNALRGAKTGKTQKKIGKETMGEKKGKGGVS